MIRYLNKKEFEVFIFDEFVINQVKEGVVLNTSHNDMLNEIVKTFFSGKRMVYISNRVKSYAVNPLIYPEAEKIPNLIAIALVPLTEKMKRNAEYERNFFDKPYEIFASISKAIEWAHQIINK